MAPKHMFLDHHFFEAPKHMFSRYWKKRKNVFWSKNICFEAKKDQKTAPKHMFLDQKHDFKLKTKKNKKTAKSALSKFVINARNLFFLHNMREI
jgi:hypothetical protein